MHTFNDPGVGGDKLPLADLLGSLLLFGVKEETDPIPTEYGDTTAVRADVAVLDGEHKKERFDDTLVFPRVLKLQLRGSVGGYVLGRLQQGAKKPGKNPPWQLAACSDDDRATATKYLEWWATQAPEAEKDEEPF